MNILVTGANGFIGSHIVQALQRQGHALTLCVRNTTGVKQRWPGANVIEVDFIRDHDEETWLARLRGMDVVINTVGIIRETRSQTFRALHTDTPRALFKACTKAGVKKVIQVSALGADATAFSQYHLSKKAADDCLVSQDLDWTILMPSIVYGPGAKSMAFFRALAALPRVPLVDKGEQQVQPVYIDDLVQLVLQVIETGKMSRQKIEVVGPEPVNFKTLYQQLRHWLGLGQAHYIKVPYRLTLLLAQLGGFMGNTPMNKEAIQMLQNGNTADAAPFAKQLGRVPMSFQAVLEQQPSQQADRWHARLYFLQPLLRYSIAFLWIVTAFVSVFVFPLETSYSMLEKAGISGLAAPVMLYGAAATDLLIGIAVLLRYRMQLTGLIQLAVIALYTLVISITQPEYWMHPFGPVTKNIPLMVSIMILMALEKK